MDWKNSKLTKLTIKSTLGGNARLKLDSTVSLKASGSTKTQLNPAQGENMNEYYQVNAIKAPLISDKADLTESTVPATNDFDLLTEKGKTYIYEVK